LSAIMRKVYGETANDEGKAAFVALVIERVET
jgi:hypothetical protein